MTRTTFGRRLCEPCGRSIGTNNWLKHTGSEKHAATLALPDECACGRRFRATAAQQRAVCGACASDKGALRNPPAEGGRE